MQKQKWDTIVKTFNNYILDEDEHDIKNYPDLNLWLRQITLTGLDIMRNPNSIIVLLCNYDVIIMAGKKTLSGVSLKIMSPTGNFQCRFWWIDIEDCL
jgi:hypothetical protein